MLSTIENPNGSFRVWVASYEDWSPRFWSEIPPTATVIEPAEPRCMTRSEAALYVEAFNRVMLHQSKRLWALPVRVTVRLDGDLAPGQTVASDAIATQLLDANQSPAAGERSAQDHVVQG